MKSANYSKNDSIIEEEGVIETEGSTKIDSPLLTTANQERKRNRKIKKDSCVDFKMGKENIITGKSDPIGPLSSSQNKNSFINATNSPANRIKMSKFKKSWFLNYKYNLYFHQETSRPICLQLQPQKGKPPNPLSKCLQTPWNRPLLIFPKANNFLP